MARFSCGPVCVRHDIFAVAKEPGRTDEQLNRCGARAVLGCLGRLREAAPYGPTYAGHYLLVCTELYGGPGGAAEAAAPSLHARPVVEDISAKAPEAAVGDDDAFSDELHPAVVVRGRNAC